MKRCNSCKQDKPLDGFSWRSKEKNVRSSKCKACHKAYVAEHYKKNSQIYKDRAVQNKKDYSPRGKAFIVEYLSSHSCVDCGEEDIEVLQFDHVDPLSNWRAPRVTSLMNNSLEKIQKEIDKCEVRCANCHVRRTRRMAGTLRTRL